MPAYFDTGFSVREPMWHDAEGKWTIDDYPEDWDDARVKAGLLWEPRLVPCYASLELPSDAKRAEALIASYDQCVVADGRLFFPLEDHQLVERDDTHAVLGVVSDQFGLVFHSVMGEILEAILEQPNVKFETAGSCKGGAQVWALAYLDEPYTVAGDDTETYPFVALLNSHDGSGACKVTRTQIRVVCWNTYQAASMQGERSGLQFVFRHAGDVAGRIEDAIEALKGARDEAKEWDALATELFGIKVDKAMFNHFMADFIPEPPAEVVSDRVRNNIDRARKVFSHLYLDSVTTESHRGTALGLIDASVEYLDHVRGFRNRDTLLGRTLLRPEPMKARALTLVRELVKR
jgi:phage/plasmid-like protein (TIGR03299 family)